MSRITRTQAAPGVAWTELREAAVAVAARGWPVVPDPDQAELVRTQKPYGALVVCGRGVDVLQVTAEVAEALPALTGAGLATPVSVTAPPPRWQLWVATGGNGLRPELESRGCALHSLGAWVALPPTNLGPFRCRWRVEPPDGALGLPDADKVQTLLVDAMKALVWDPDSDRGGRS